MVSSHSSSAWRRKMASAAARPGGGQDQLASLALGHQPVGAEAAHHLARGLGGDADLTGDVGRGHAAAVARGDAQGEQVLLGGAGEVGRGATRHGWIVPRRHARRIRAATEGRPRVEDSAPAGPGAGPAAAGPGAAGPAPGSAVGCSCGSAAAGGMAARRPPGAGRVPGTRGRASGDRRTRGGSASSTCRTTGRTSSRRPSPARRLPRPRRRRWTRAMPGDAPMPAGTASDRRRAEGQRSGCRPWPFPDSTSACRRAATGASTARSTAGSSRPDHPDPPGSPVGHHPRVSRTPPGSPGSA